MDRQDASENDIRAVIIDCSSVTTIDTSAVRLVERVAAQYAKSNRKMLFANWRGIDRAGMQVMENLKFETMIPQEHFFLTIGDAVDYVHRQHSTEMHDDVEADVKDALESKDLLSDIQLDPACKEDAESNAAVQDVQGAERPATDRVDRKKGIGLTQGRSQLKAHLSKMTWGF